MKKSVLYASPFNPKKSGISDYSEVLIFLLAKRFEVFLFVDDYELENQDIFNQFPVIRKKELLSRIDSFDYRIYNIGNNPWYHSYMYNFVKQYPGLIIMHDVCLYYLYVGVHQAKRDFFSSIYKHEGKTVFDEVKRIEKRGGSFDLQAHKLAETFFLNKEVLTSNNKIMVHSDYAKHLIQETAPDVCIRKINMIPQINDQYTIVDKKLLFDKYGVPCDKMIVASFGYISDTKQNLQIAKCINELVKKNGYDICYVMVGEGTTADAYLEDEIVIKTGYTDLNEFNSFIEYADIVVNLRYPSRGETSAAMVRAMSLGKPSIVTDDAWFSEIPQECTLHVPPINMEPQLKQQLVCLIQDTDLRDRLGNAAKDYFSREFVGEKIVDDIVQFLDE